MQTWSFLSVRTILAKGGLFPVWKPSGNYTSNDVVQKLKGEIERNVRALKKSRTAEEKELVIPPITVGHGGTLDPFASGVMVLGVNQGCKSLPQFLQCNKDYLVTATLGMATDTYDRMGQVTNEAPWQHITKADIERVLPKQRGKFLQTTPMFSARSVKGQRLYQLARRGLTVDTPKKEVNVMRLECIDYTPPNVTLSLVVSAGTYVRSIVHELGESLGCHAYASELVRTRQAGFTESECLFEKDWQFEKIMTALFNTSLGGVKDDSLLKPVGSAVQPSRPVRVHNDNDELLRGFLNGEVNSLPSTFLIPSNTLRSSKSTTSTTETSATPSASATPSTSTHASPSTLSSDSVSTPSEPEASVGSKPKTRRPKTLE